MEITTKVWNLQHVDMNSRGSPGIGSAEEVIFLWASYVFGGQNKKKTKITVLTRKPVHSN